MKTVYILLRVKLSLQSEKNTYPYVDNLIEGMDFNFYSQTDNADVLDTTIAGFEVDTEFKSKVIIKIKLRVETEEIISIDEFVQEMVYDFTSQTNGIKVIDTKILTYDVTF